ncbi:MAG: protein kinase, partial [Acidobacteria bacterium]|nr:protein kinase [Acidobacteriota bacterium]
LDALDTIHAAGLIHGDVKPANVMREEGGRIVLMDFGIGLDRSRTGAVGSSGTPLYLAPEILEGAPATPGSDLYALGVLLFFLVTGQYPVTGASLSELRQAHRTGRRRLLRDLRPDLPRDFVEVVEKALAADPQQRFRSAGEMEGALEGVFPGSGHFRTRPVFARLRSGGKSSRWRLAAIAAGLFLTLFLAFRLYPHDALSQALIREAEKERWKGNLDLAGWLAGKALWLEPDDPWALLPLEISARAEGDFGLALALARKAYEHRDTYRTQPHVMMKVEARYALNLGDLPLFERQMKNLLRLDPEDPDGDRWLTLAALLRGEFEEAQEYAKKAKRLSHRGDPVGRGMLALALAQSGQGNESLEELKALRLDWIGPDPPFFSWVEGLALLVDDRLEEAEAALHDLAEGTPEYESNARFFLAQTHVLEGDLRRAVEELRTAAGDDQDQAFSGARNRKLLLLYELCHLLGEDRQAGAVLEKLGQPKELFPEEAADLKEVGVALARGGDSAGALAIQARLEELALEIERSTVEEGGSMPFGAGATTRLRSLGKQVKAEVFFREGDPDSALRMIDGALEGSWDTSLLVSAARIYKNQGSCPNALPFLEKIDQRKGLILHDHPATWWLLTQLDLAECYLATGAPEASAKALARFLFFWGESLDQLPELAGRVAALKARLAMPFDSATSALVRPD